ncbi:DoxX family protein [Nocardia crassostreae]|uniref:DoxX family protein n=1 Tax=Nocardia crassostreae TaxID=53428 RepID=UPI0009FDB2E2|nr:DoxX family protein [Nocardia crassostreae]
MTTTAPLSPATVDASGRALRLINSYAGTTLGSRARFAIFLAASGIVLTESVVGAYWDLARIPYVQETFAGLQYPMYFASILGAAKVAAVGALVVPGFARLKEWAYAGLFFVYAGASLSHLAVGDPAAKWVGPLVFAGLTLASWGLRAPAQRDPKPLPQALRFRRSAVRR